MLPSASTEIHLAASKALAQVVEKELIPTHIFTTTCLPSILAQVDSKEKSKCRWKNEGDREVVRGRELWDGGDGRKV